MDTHHAAFAGQFYPQESLVLKKEVEAFLSFAKSYPAPKILIVPHAGYLYSGKTAGIGYATLRNSEYDRVILLGCSHQAYFAGAAIDDSKSWETPLGEVLVDSAVTELIDNPLYLKLSRKEHLNEHSLEVQLPFLQCILKPGFTILPILLGQIPDVALHKLIEKIQIQLFNHKTVLIISSDLSHYPALGLAEKIDSETIDLILQQNVKELYVHCQQKVFDYEAELVTCACGERAIEVGMAIAEANHYSGKLIDHSTSALATKDTSSVVGYASIGFFEKGALK